MFLLTNRPYLVLSKPDAIYADRFLEENSVQTGSQLLPSGTQHGYNLRSCQTGRIAEPHSRHRGQRGLAFEIILLWRLEEDLEEGAQPGPVTAPLGMCIPACGQRYSSE